MKPLNLNETLMLGLWALFLASAAALALLTILSLPRLPYLVENFHADSYDTILSVQLFHGHGPFADAPYFTRPHTLFGNFPLLFAFLASLIMFATSDASLSVTLLYWVVELAIAALLWTTVLRKCDWKVKLLFVAFFLCNIAFGNLFPLGYRKRQQLAILVGLGMFLAAHPAIRAVLGFLAVLAQPFTGAAIVVLKAADSLWKKDWRTAALLIIAAALAYPFYSGLLSSTSLEPAMPGCGLLTFRQFNPMYLAVLPAAFLLFFAHNRRMLDGLSIAALAMAVFTPLAFISFITIKDVLPYGIVRPFLYLASMPCPESLLNVAALAMAVLVGLRGFALRNSTIAILLIVSLLSMDLLIPFLLPGQAVTTDVKYDTFIAAVQEAGISSLKTHEAVVSYYSGAYRFTPVFTLFPAQGYCILKGCGLTFVDEVNLPPQMSRGGANLPMADIPESIFSGDSETCRSSVAELRSAGVEALVYLVDFDFTVPDGTDAGAFTDQATLSSCGLELMANTTSDGHLSVIYKVGENDTHDLAHTAGAQ